MHEAHLAHRIISAACRAARADRAARITRVTVEVGRHAHVDQAGFRAQLAASAEQTLAHDAEFVITTSDADPTLVRLTSIHVEDD